MRYVIPTLLAAAVLATACGDNQVQDSCYDACADWTTCVDGDCIPKEGRCSANDHCGQGFTCEVEVHLCAPVPVVCEPDCEEWEECNAGGTCELAFGRCNQHADCVEVCDFVTHTCVLSDCQPLCEPWQMCEAAVCVTLPGRCADNTDCADPTPVCSELTHECGFPPTPATAVDRTAPRALIVTTSALSAPFQELAELHTLTGVTTELVTLEDLCARRTCDDGDPRQDTAKALKDELAARPGLAYVVLGGDVEHVPAREVHDSYANTFYGVSYEQTFFTDYYYADLSEWDGNGNGLYAVDGEDAPDYRPELAVARIPVSTLDEADRYLQKVRDYLTTTDVSKVRQALFLSNVAARVQGMDIDGAAYLEMPDRTIGLFPADFAFTKLYATGYGSQEVMTAARQNEELQKGPGIVVHAGHGSYDDLTVETDGSEAFTGAMATGLTNTNLPIVLSCACDAGTFAQEALVSGVDHDSPGELLLNAPAGGAIGYMGNGATGLGPAGSSQIIDEFLRAAFTADSPNPRVGDALKAAHQNMPTSDSIRFVIRVPTVDQDSYEWTQKASVYLGDPLVPVWTAPELAPSPFISVERTVGDSGSQLRFDFFGAGSGTLRFDTGSHLYEVPVQDGAPVLVELPEVPARVRVGLVTDGSLHGFLDKTF